MSLLLPARPNILEQTFGHTLQSCFNEETGARPVEDDVPRHIVLLTNDETSDNVVLNQSMVSELHKVLILCYVVTVELARRLKVVNGPRFRARTVNVSPKPNLISDAN